MDSEIYVGIKVEWSVDFGSHVVKADVPDALYNVRNAWTQEEVEAGLWILRLSRAALDFLAANPTVEQELIARGARNVRDGKPACGSLRGRSKTAGYTLPRKLGEPEEETTVLVR